MNLLAVWVDSLTWTCPNCQWTTTENFCSFCGRQLTAADLTSQDPRATSADENAHGSQHEGD